MKEKDNISNQGSGCLTNGMLVQYIKGELSGLEMNQVERHLTTCEMCSDELEGLLEMENLEEIEQVSLELNQRIDSITTIPKKEIPYFGLYIRLAASVIIILGISTIIYLTAFRENTAISPNYVMMETMNVPSESAPSSDTVLKSVVDGSKMENLKLAENREAKGRQSAENENAKSEETLKYVAPVVVDSVVNDDAVVEVMDEGLDKSAVVEETEMAKVSEVAESIVQAVSSAERKRTLAPSGLANKEISVEGVKLTGLAYGPKEESAIRLFSKEKYRDALLIFDEIRLNHSDNDTIEFYSSLCCYNLNRFKETIVRIEVLAKNPKCAFYNEAKWYYALALIGDNRREDAISVLEQIVKENSPFKRKANRELERLKSR